MQLLLKLSAGFIGEIRFLNVTDHLESYGQKLKILHGKWL